MKLTKQVKLVPSNDQRLLLDATMAEYISLANDLIDYGIACGSLPQLTSALVIAKLPSALKAQCIRDVQSIWSKTMKHGGKFPILKKPVAIWNNQNYRIDDFSISFPVLVDGKCTRISVKAEIPSDALDVLWNSKLGTLRITRKNDKYIAQIAYEAVETTFSGSEVMGVDLGILCPAVAKTSTGKVKFYGSGRQRKQVRRAFYSRRKKLGKAKKLKALKKAKDKEQRWMRDQDHKISRAIVNDAISQGVGAIKLEMLQGIRSRTQKNDTTRKSRKHIRQKNRMINSWSFYRLAHYIEYKARLAGIDVVYVDPAYTSQVCPHCGALHKAQGRGFFCPDCGYHVHRDIVGAANILAA